MIYLKDAQVYINPSSVDAIEVTNEGWQIIYGDGQWAQTADANAVNLLIKAINYFLGKTKINDY